MSLSGYCFSNGIEYRKEDKITLTQETARVIEALALEKVENRKKPLFPAADGQQTTVKLGYEDGSEREIALSPQQKTELLELLTRELVKK